MDQGTEAVYSTALVKALMDKELADDDIDYRIGYNGVKHYVPICK